MGVKERTRDVESEPPFQPPLQPPPLPFPRKKKKRGNFLVTASNKMKIKPYEVGRKQGFLFLSLCKCSTIKGGSDKLAALVE